MRIERYAYDRAGRLVREGNRTYRYGYLDKVLSVTDGKRSYRYAYHVDGQLARADYGDGGRAGVGEDGRAGSPLPAGSEAFLWDGLALVRRGDESFVNEPHVGDAPKKLRFGGKPRAKRSARRARKGPRGSPVASSKGAVYFNDLLGTTVGVREGRGPLRAKQGDKAPRYTAAALTAFGEPLPGQGAEGLASDAFFTGKPSVPGLGYAFLLRSYRPDLAKWQTADPLGYPDGWNPLVYCGNAVLNSVDIMGGYTREVQDPSYPQTRSVRLSDWIYHHTSWDTKWYYSWWETYTETRYIIYEVTTTSTLMDYVHNGLTFTAIVGSVVVSIAVAAPGGQPVAVIGGIVTSVAALGAWLTEHESDQTEIVKGDRIEKSNVVREKRWKSVKIETGWLTK